MLARAPASPAQSLHHYGPRYFNFSYFCMMYGLEKLRLVDQNCYGVANDSFIYLLKQVGKGGPLYCRRSWEV